MSKSNQLTILFITLDSYGHIHSCIGVADKLVEHGHRVLFALEKTWKGTVMRYNKNIEEVIFVDKNRDQTLNANEHWIKFMDEFKNIFGLSPLKALEKRNIELEKQFIETMLNVNDELKELIDQHKPDIIVVDSYTTIPAIYKSNIPWVWLTSANPLSCLPDYDNLPPMGTDYPINGDRKQWKEYLELFFKHMTPVLEHFNKRMIEEFDIEPSTHGIHHESPYLNIYAYPKELDYIDIRPLPPKWKSFDHFIRFGEKNESFKILDEFLNKSLGKLIYVSMGSLGCADVNLLNRLLTIASKSPNRFIFSLGPHKNQLIQLSDNVWGDSFLPQMQILPKIDLVITHGGNNTIIESLYFGKPMIVTPLFGDQLNNAQRVTECGFGQKINPYTCDIEEFLLLIEKLLSDTTMHERLMKISNRLQLSNSTENAAIAIEQIANV